MTGEQTIPRPLSELAYFVCWKPTIRIVIMSIVQQCRMAGDVAEGIASLRPSRQPWFTFLKGQ